jgi:hypothetical protein
MGTPIPAGSFSFWDLPPPHGTATHVWHTGLAIVMWSIWKARNDLAFNAKTSSAGMVHRRVANNLALWRWRYRIHDRGQLDTLCNFLLSPV